MNKIRTIYCILFCILYCLTWGCDSQQSLINRGHRWFDRGNFTSAIKNFTWALEINPNNAHVYYFRGLSYLRIEQYDHAIEDFTKAIELDSLFAEAYLNRGIVLKKKGKLKKSLSDYNKAINLDPNYFESYYLRADLWFQTGEYQYAISNYNICIKNNYKISWSYMYRGDSYYMLEQYQNANDDYKKSIEFDESNAFAYNNLAWLLATCINKEFRNGQLALSYAQKAVSLESNVNNLHTLAVAYAENGMFRKAISIMEKILSGNEPVPDNFKIHLNQFINGKPLREAHPQTGQVQKLL